MDNLLLNLLVYKLATEKEVALFETTMKLTRDWQVSTHHKKGDYIILACYNYTPFLEGFDVPTIEDVDYGIFCIYSTTEKRIIEVIRFNTETDEVTPNVKLSIAINEMIKLHSSTAYLAALTI